MPVRPEGRVMHQTIGDTESPADTTALSPRRQRIIVIVNRALNAMMVFGTQLRSLLKRVDKLALTLIILVLVLPLISPSGEQHLAAFSHTTEFSIGLIGTVLVLTFTLSMIPVQRAAESMPVSVVRLFAGDFISALLFITLALYVRALFLAGLVRGGRASATGHPASTTTSGWSHI